MCETEHMFYFVGELFDMTFYRDIENNMVLPEALERYYCTDEEKKTAEQRRKDLFRETERRLYALPVLRRRVQDNREELEELESLGIEALKHCSSSMVRLLRPGIRLTPEEVHAAQIAHIRGRLAADEREIKRVQGVLDTMYDDPYFLSIEMRYFLGLSDAVSSEKLCCDPTTVRRNRKRLVRRLALLLYGAEAI